ncbi:MAG: helix-turn-helix transcriptional regulator [Oscillospiraceae bacterium]|nr:helix-turn-helix transcriptional regulator [Oscillospiraceae bacterium]
MKVYEIVSVKRDSKGNITDEWQKLATFDKAEADKRWNDISDRENHEYREWSEFNSSESEIADYEDLDTVDDITPNTALGYGSGYNLVTDEPSAPAPVAKATSHEPSQPDYPSYDSMGFSEIRSHSAGYAVIFENGSPAGYGMEASDSATQRDIDNADDYFGESDARLCRAADGMMYKVVGDKYTSVNVWARVELISDHGKRLAHIREYKGTLKYLSEKTGIPAQNISRLETGARDVRKASGETLLKLAEALDVTMEELVR